MADNKKFEKMIELLINEDKQAAEDLFHEIVVEKSREIYENILEKEYDEMDDDMDMDDDEDEKEDLKDEWELDEDNLLDDWDLEEDDEFYDAVGGDETDDMIGDISADDMDMDDEDDMDMDMGMDSDMDMDSDMGADDETARIEDLEDEVEDLKAKLEQLLGDKDEDDDMDMDMDMGDKDEDEDGDMDMDMDMGDDEDEDEDEEEDEVTKPKTESKKSASERMREYVEKVSHGSGPYGDTTGDDGDNKTSPVAGKNDMGGTVANLNKGGEAGPGGTKGGLSSPDAKKMNTGNINVPGGKASKSMQAMPKGHGAEKKGSGETATNKKSTLGSK